MKKKIMENKKKSIVVLIILTVLIISLISVVTINVVNKEEYNKLEDKMLDVTGVNNLDLGFIHTKTEIETKLSELSDQEDKINESINKIKDSMELDLSKFITSNKIDTTSIDLEHKNIYLKSIAVVEDLKSITNNASYTPKEENDTITKKQKEIDKKYNEVYDLISNETSKEIKNIENFIKSIKLNSLTSEQITILKEFDITLETVEKVNEINNKIKELLKDIKNEESDIEEAKQEEITNESVDEETIDQSNNYANDYSSTTTISNSNTSSTTNSTSTADNGGNTTITENKPVEKPTEPETTCSSWTESEAGAWARSQIGDYSMRNISDGSFVVTYPDGTEYALIDNCGEIWYY